MFPRTWFRSQGFSTCEVCRSFRFNGRCFSCFHVVASSRGRPPPDSRPVAEGAPGIWDVSTNGPRVRSSVPVGARDAWSRCRIIALADVIAHRDVRSSTDLLALPALVLAVPSRGGRRHTLRLDNDTRRRCLDWVVGIRTDLRTPERAPTRTSTWMRFPTQLYPGGALRRACAALPQDHPVSTTSEVVSSLCALHPAPHADERAGMGSLRRVASLAAPDAMRPASSDLLLRLITEVVNLLLQGEVPESVRPFVCGASIMALRKLNGTLRPIDVARSPLNSSRIVYHHPHHPPVVSQTSFGPSKTAISVDISNAFNTVHRSAVVYCASLRCPSVHPHSLSFSRSMGGPLSSPLWPSLQGHQRCL